MAGSETDAGADAVALAIRDLMGEIKCVRRILCGFGYQLLLLNRKNMTQEAVDTLKADLDAIRLAP